MAILTQGCERKVRQRKRHVQSSKSPLLDASVALENIASFASSCLQVYSLLKHAAGTYLGRSAQKPTLESMFWPWICRDQHGRWLDGNWCNSGGKSPTSIPLTTFCRGWKCQYHSALSSFLSNCPPVSFEPSIVPSSCDRPLSAFLASTSQTCH